VQVPRHVAAALAGQSLRRRQAVDGIGLPPRRNAAETFALEGRHREDVAAAALAQQQDLGQPPGAAAADQLHDLAQRDVEVDPGHSPFVNPAQADRCRRGVRHGRRPSSQETSFR
jgi:hypothetical protein